MTPGTGPAPPIGGAPNTICPAFLADRFWSPNFVEELLDASDDDGALATLFGAAITSAIFLAAVVPLCAIVDWKM